MPSPSKRNDHPAESPKADVVDVIDRVARIENIINQIIVDYCKPRKEAWEFMWTVVLDTSVMPLGAKVKVVMAIAHKMSFKLEKNVLHRLIELRNAFAHHSSDAHSVLAIGRTPEEDTSYFELSVLKGSGKISREKRHEAFADFNAVYCKARDSLVELKKMVREAYSGDA